MDFAHATGHFQDCCEQVRIAAIQMVSNSNLFPLFQMLLGFEIFQIDT